MKKGILREVGKQVGGFLRTAKRGLKSYGGTPRKQRRTGTARRRRHR